MVSVGTEHVEAPPTWHRVPRWLHRTVPGHVLLAALGGDERTLGGLSAAVWVVLDEPGTADEVSERIHWLAPEVPAEPKGVVEALAMMADGGAVERQGHVTGASP